MSVIDWVQRQVSRAWDGLMALVGIGSADEQKSAFKTMWMAVWIVIVIAVGVAVPSPFDYLLYVTAVVGFVAFLRQLFPGFNSVWNRVTGKLMFWR